MCQKNKNTRNKIVKGAMAVNKNGVIVFLAQSQPRKVDDSFYVLNKRITLTSYLGFIRHCRMLNIIPKGSSALICDKTTVHLLYKEFAETEFNTALNNLILPQGINYPSAANKETALTCEGGNSHFNIWLDYSRRWLRSQLARVSSLPWPIHI